MKESKSTDLFVFDLDGTIVHDLGPQKRGVPPSLLNAIFELEKKAHVVVATGRRYKAALPDLETLPPMPFRIVHNGLVVKDAEGSGVFSASLDLSVALESARLIEESGHSPFLISDGHAHGLDYIYTQHSLETSPVIQILKSRPHQQSRTIQNWQDLLNERDSLPPFLEVATLGPVAEMEKLYLSLTSRLPATVRAVFVRNIGHPRLAAVEVFEKQHSKASAVQWVRKKMRLERVIAVGDDGNDLEMIREADIGVAMDHADEGLKASAKVRVQGPEGLENFIREYLRS